jgi:hypothetical protein
MSKEAMKLALEALYLAVRMEPSDSIHECPEMFQGAITALRNELAKQEQGEPVSWEKILGAVSRGWCHEENANKTMDIELAMAIVKEVKALYTTPQQRTWVSLTDEQMRKICGSVATMREAVREAEAILKEGNI